MNPVYTIGYSNHELGTFIGLLRANHITAVADVRSQPNSRLPHFNQGPLRDALRQHGIQYVFLGTELGARREERECYVDGQAVYERVATLPLFRAGLDRIVKGASRYTIAIMCAEKEPLDCHRTVLICRNLRPLVPAIRHIHADGRVEEHAEAETRLLKLAGITPGQRDLFASDEQQLERAYESRGRQIAYRMGQEGGSDEPAHES